MVGPGEGFVHVGEFEDGRPGEVFLRMAKQGSTLAGLTESLGLAVSIGLQFGVPLAAFGTQFVNLRFEPAGETNDPEVPTATSVLDYVFRRLALDYPPEDMVTTEVPQRERLPARRPKVVAQKFSVGDAEGFVHVGEFADGRPGEVFLRMAKQGSTLAGFTEALGIAVSLGLQYGAPLRAYVKQFVNLRFEPAGITADPDLRFASSIVDFVFRSLAIAYLDVDDRIELGVLTTRERSQLVTDVSTKHNA